MFVPGHRVGVAVSGGADSVALLDLLRELAPRWNLALSVLHVDHGWRDDSSEDARFAGELAGAHGMPFHVRTLEPGPRQGGNLEQTARLARREFFLGFLKAGLLDRVALGHTRSDQAETVLFRILRGAGATGLAGLRPVSPEGLVRPLLEVTRGEVEDWLRARGLDWREDSTNRDPRFARNRIRHFLLPDLEREWNPALSETLAQMAVLAGDEEDYWRGQIDGVAEGLLCRRGQAVLLRADRLAGLPPAVARRLLRRAVGQVRGDLRQIEFGHIEQILELGRRAEGDGRAQIPGVDVFRSFEWIRLAPPGMDRLENRNWRLRPDIPGRIAIPGMGTMLELCLAEASWNVSGESPTPDSGYTVSESELDWERISGPIELRNWRPGDQYEPAGRGRQEKIKFLFQQFRIPLWERRGWPILTVGDLILWAKRFGPAAGLEATPASRTVLRIREVPEALSG